MIDAGPEGGYYDMGVWPLPILINCYLIRDILAIVHNLLFLCFKTPINSKILQNFFGIP
jgi:hypothetical protein